MSTPSLRGFQLDGSAIGDAANSVNLFRGDVNLPLRLVHLAGPHGLDVAVAAHYGSNVAQQVDCWNRDAPTGILGLGWSLPYDVISFEGGGTASWLEGRFVLTTGGSRHPLILVSWDGSGSDQRLTFADPLNPLWTIVYAPADERWQVRRDDGVTLVFGDASSGRATVQWGVRFGNFAGASGATGESFGGSPERFGIAWNLASMTDPWGSQVTYAYAADEVEVSSGLAHTRASYLTLITDAHHRTVRFTYGEKLYDPNGAREYQPRHTVTGAPPASAYQDRYETRYLAAIDVCPAGSDGSDVY